MVKEALLIIPFALVTLLYLFTLKYKPQWGLESNKTWMRSNHMAYILSLLTMALSSVIYHHYPNLEYIGITSSIIFLTYCMIQSFFTDFKYKLVDRRTLYFSMILPLIINTLVLMSGPDIFIKIWIMLMIVCLVFTFLPLKSFGASDGRAFLLAVIACFPVLGLNIFMRTTACFIPLIILYAVVNALIHSRKDFFKALMGKQNIPAVPLILLPFLVSLFLVEYL